MLFLSIIPDFSRFVKHFLKKVVAGQQSGSFFACSEILRFALALARRRIRRQMFSEQSRRHAVGRVGIGDSESVVCCSVCHDFLLFVANRGEYLKKQGREQDFS